MRREKLLVVVFSVLIAVIFVFGLAGNIAFAARKKTIGIVTVDLTSATMKRFATSFQKRAKHYGWRTILVGCQGDYGKANSTIENFVSMRVDGIFNDMNDPNLVKESLKKAYNAGIPVVNGDAGWSDLVVTNVTSNNYMLSARVTTFLFDKMTQDGKTELLSVTWPQHHGIRKRERIMKAILPEYPNIKLDEEHITYISGVFEDCRKWMANYLTGHPNFKGAVWCAWDEPAAAVTQAIEAAGKQDEIYVTGIDGNIWTFDKYIRRGSPFIATEAQNFELMGFMIADIFNEIFTGQKKPTDYPPNIYVPTLLITQDNCPASGTYPWLDTGPWREQYEQLATWPPY